MSEDALVNTGAAGWPSFRRGVRAGLAESSTTAAVPGIDDLHRIMTSFEESELMGRVHHQRRHSEHANEVSREVAHARQLPRPGVAMRHSAGDIECPREFVFHGRRGLAGARVVVGVAILVPSLEGTPPCVSR